LNTASVAQFVSFCHKSGRLGPDAHFHTKKIAIKTWQGENQAHILHGKQKKKTNTIFSKSADSMKGT
jgi:hypothetical protein